MRASLGRWAVALRMLCALAMLAVGFSHSMPVQAFAKPLNLSAYMLPDGTRPVICVTDINPEKDNQRNGHLPARDCEACQIGQVILLAAPPATFPLPARVVPCPMLPMTAEMLSRPRLPPNTGPRAPPHPFLTA